MLLAGFDHPPDSVQSSQVLKGTHAVVQRMVVPVDLRLYELLWFELDAGLHVVGEEIVHFQFGLLAEQLVFGRYLVLTFGVLPEIEQRKNR